jgi:pimeloyl-ACP methyl ester carboxylesterase
MRNPLLLACLLAACAHVPPPQDSFVAGPQGRLHVEDGGSGAAVPVLLVHGNGGNLGQWRAQLDHLRASRRAVAFDLRGMGKSDVPANGDYSVAAMAGDVQAVADALHLDRFVIVGHSYGGAVVAQYAAKHPERVAGAIYADSGGDVKMDDAVADKFIAALRKDKDGVARAWFDPILRHATDATKEAVFASVHATPVDAFAGALNGLRFIDMHALVAAYHGPAYAIAASDIASPMSFHVQFPRIPVKYISGTGHWLMMDRPGEFNRALDEFLAAM